MTRAALPAGRAWVMNYRLKVVLIQLGGLLALLGLWWFFTDVHPIWPKYVMPDPAAVWTEIKFGLFGQAPDGKLSMAIVN